jgi:DNA-binding PadR family transcriptional regulator
MRGDHPGRGGLHRGRKLASEDLQLVLLTLLAQRPYHGYELIKQLSERSSGFYNPSSGMVYPALAFLVDVGHAVADVQGMKKSYSLTEEGRAYLAMHQATADAILADLERTGARMAQVRRIFDGDEADTVVPGTPEDLMLARYALKQALMQAPCAEPAEARRIAAILRRAADEIRGR